MTKCYQQAASLVLMAADEVEKLLVVTYLHKVLYTNCEAREKLCHERNSKQYGLLITKGYWKWLKTKQRTTTKKVFRMLVNFVLLSDEYREFQMGKHWRCNNDRMPLSRFSPKILSHKKKHSVKIILTKSKRSTIR